MKPILKTGDSKFPSVWINLSRVVAIGGGIEIFQCKMEPFILSQINNSCPPGQTDTIPSGDSIRDVPKIDLIAIVGPELLVIGLL